MVRERYGAFGDRRRGEAPLNTDQLYTGQRYKALSSLYHYSNGKSAGRFYDPLLGRFLQPDPLRVGTGSQSLNPYSYVLNNPLKAADPSGYCPTEDTDEYGRGVPSWTFSLADLYRRSGFGFNVTGDLRGEVPYDWYQSHISHS